MQTLTANQNISTFGTESSAMTFDGHAITRNADGTATVTGFPVFKAGTFRDSMGDQTTWTTDHLYQMASNFDLLKSRDIFPNVPVRIDHSYTMEKVMGYFDGLSVSSDGQMLLADYTITEPDQVEKVARGTYRSRSMEVGLFESNSGEMYFPVAFGFAFVDIPAVEGLHSKNPAVKHFSMTTNDTKESTMSETLDDKGASKPAVTASVVTPVGTHNHTLSNSTNTLTLGSVTGAVVHTFRVNGATVTDFAAVQLHIDGLESFAKETREGNRKAFVSSLAAKGQIAAPQAEAMTEMVLDMSAEQFEKFKTAYADAPVLSILAKHGSTGTAAPAGEASEQDDAIAILRESIQQHRRAGLSEQQIANTASFKKLAALTASKN